MHPVCLYLATPAGSRPQCEDSKNSHQTTESLWRVSPSVPPGAFGWAPVSHGRCGSREPQSWPTSGGSRLHWCLRMQNCANLSRLWIRNKTKAKSNDQRDRRATETHCMLFITCKWFVTFFHCTQTFHMPHFTAMLLTLIGAYCAAISLSLCFFTWMWKS